MGVLPGDKIPEPMNRKQRRALKKLQRKHGPPSGTVVPPDKTREHGPGHRAQKAREFCAEAIASGKYMLIAFALRPDNAVEIKWSTNDFPLDRFHDAAQLFTDLLNNELAAHGISLEDMQRAALRQAERLQREREQAQISEPGAPSEPDATVVAETGPAELGTEPVILPLHPPKLAEASAPSDELDALLNALPSSLGAPSPVPVESVREPVSFDAPEPATDPAPSSEPSGAESSGSSGQE